MAITKEQIIINDLNCDNFKQGFEDYSQETSIYCAQLSIISYWSESKIEKFYNEFNKVNTEANTYFKFIEHTESHTQALLWGNKDFLIIAFRGTEPKKIKDWFTDAKFWNYRSNPDGDPLYYLPPGHGGFRTSLINLIKEKKLYKEIDDIIAKCDENIEKKKFPIFLTGHSLGAGLSQLFIDSLSKHGYNFSGAYHLAPPLAVASSVNHYMKENYGNKVYDIVNYKDYVTRAGRIGVAHFGKYYRLNKQGIMFKEDEVYYKFRFWEYLLEIRLHSKSNHLKRIKKTQNSTELINERSK